MTRAEHAKRPNRSSRWISEISRLAIYLRDNLTCVYCTRSPRTHGAVVLSLDHLIPREKGGSDQPANLVTACVNCNAARKIRPWRAFANADAVIRIQRCRRRTLNRPAASAILRGLVPHPLEQVR